MPRVSCLVCLTWMVSTAFAGSAEAEPDKVMASLIKAYNADDAASFYRLLSPDFQKARPLEQFQTFLKGARATFGTISGWSRDPSEGPWLVYRCRAEKEPCTVKLVVDDAGRVSGFQLNRVAAVKVAADKTVAGLVSAYNTGAAADLHKLFDSTLQKALPLEQLEPLLKKQRAASGLILSCEQARAAGAWRLYRARTEKQDFTLRVAIASDGRLSGLRFTAPLTMVLPAGPIKLADLKMRFKDAAERTMAEHRFPSISAALVKGDRLVWAEGFGHLNVARQVRADKDTVYVTGSILKVLVATAVLQLVEEGKLSLDTPVNDLLKGFQVPSPFEKETPLTVRHLLSHRGGLPNGGSEVPLWRRELPASLDETLRRHVRVVDPPGKRTVYSNFGYSLLGCLVGQQSGKPFEQALRDRLFAPLAMAQTAFEPTPEMTENLAIPYEDDPRHDKLRASYRVRLDVYPAGDLYATPSDFGHFLLMHLNGGTYAGRELLRPESVKEMARLQYEKRAGGMGLGWVVDYRNSRPLLWHNGGVRGFSSYMAIDPEQRLGVVLFANKFDPENDPLPDLAIMGLELLEKLAPGSLNEKSP